MTGRRAIVVEGPGAIAGVEPDLPAINDRGILVGLPGGDVYLRRDVERGLIAERRLHDLAVIRSLKLGEFIRDNQARRLGGQRVRPNIDRAKDDLRRERARASGIIVPENTTTAPAENALAAFRRFMKGKR